MATKKALVATDQARTISDTDSLLVGTGIDRSTAGALTVGAATATSVTVTPPTTLEGLTVGRGPGAVSTNTVVGTSAGSGITTGSALTIVGNSAGSGITTGSNLTVIGSGAAASSATATNEVTIGNSSVAVFRIGTAATGSPAAGQAGFSVQSANTGPTRVVIAHSGPAASQPFAQFWVNGSNGAVPQAAITQAGGGGGFPILYSTGSDYRLKQDVEAMDTANALARVQSLRPVRFHYTEQADGPLIEGFIAHEVQAVVPQAVTHSKDAVDAEGKPQYQGFDQAHLVPLLTAACQELAAKAQAAEARAAAAEARLTALEAAVAALQAG